MEICYNRNGCYGCGACQSVCPHKAIKLSNDCEGFRVPKIDESKCVECGLCKKVCPANQPELKDCEVEKIYGFKLTDVNDRIKSSSGGAFIALARRIIDLGGYVCGACYDDNFHVVHKIVDSLEDLDDLRGSKYVQSNIEDIFLNIEKKLKEGKFVLFSGTPCQCDALRQYCFIKKTDTENLYLCDIICHGVPSPMLWDEYCNFIQTETKRVVKYSFRDKSFGWHGSNISVQYNDGTIKKNTQKLKIFSNLYFSSLITRKSCEQCKYTHFNRPSDITIGDFWGCEKYLPSFCDAYGVSVLILHTNKAIKLFESIKNNYEAVEINREMCFQKHLVSPVKFSLRRDEFWKDYSEQGFLFVSKKYAGYTFVGIIKRRIKNIIKKIYLSVKR